MNSQALFMLADFKSASCAVRILRLISSILYYTFFLFCQEGILFSRTSLFHCVIHHFITTRTLFPLDITYYNTSISIRQVLFLENLLAPIMCTNLTISFWMQPIILITVMLINQINKQAIYKCS